MNCKEILLHSQLSLSLSLSLSSLLLLPASSRHFNSPAWSVLSFSSYFRVTSVFHQVAQQVHSFPTCCSLPKIPLHSSLTYITQW